MSCVHLVSRNMLLLGSPGKRIVDLIDLVIKLDQAIAALGLLPPKVSHMFVWYVSMCDMAS